MSAEDPLVVIAALDAAMEAACRRCSHCRVRVELTRGGGDRYSLGETHEAGCPEYVDEDAMPAAEYDPARLSELCRWDGLA
ncbi:MAG TPA: hypothetical protein VHO29_04085 [Marmoricola sp.]|nr:hypothetical protein [Marmoricola sp.]